jgi:hypothetical protein
MRIAIGPMRESEILVAAGELSNCSANPFRNPQFRIPHFLSVCLAPCFGRGVPFRQGLWITDLQTPPGQECSNGSMLCVAVVL